MAHIRQSRPDSGIGFQVKVLEMIQCVPVWIGSGEDFSPYLEFLKSPAVDRILHTIGRSRPDSGLGFHVKVLKTILSVPSWLGSGGELSPNVDP